MTTLATGTLKTLVFTGVSGVVEKSLTMANFWKENIYGPYQTRFERVT